MAHFYGTITGTRGPTSRLGHTTLHVTAQSFEGDIIVNLERTAEGDKVQIAVRDHGHGNSQTLYYGFIKDLLDMEHRAAQMHALGVQKFHDNFKGDE